MVTYEHTKVTETNVVFIARDSVNIFKVYGETVANFGFIASVKQSRNIFCVNFTKVALNCPKSPKVTAI